MHIFVFDEGSAHMTRCGVTNLKLAEHTKCSPLRGWWFSSLAMSFRLPSQELNGFEVSEVTALTGPLSNLLKDPEQPERKRVKNGTTLSFPTCISVYLSSSGGFKINTTSQLTSNPVISWSRSLFTLKTKHTGSRVL